MHSAETSVARRAARRGFGAVPLTACPARYVWPLRPTRFILEKQMPPRRGDARSGKCPAHSGQPCRCASGPLLPHVARLCTKPARRGKKAGAARPGPGGTSRRPLRPHSRVLPPVPWSCRCRAACLPLQHDPQGVGSCVLRPAACEMPAPNLAAYRGASFTETSIIWMPTSPQEPTMA